VKVFSLSTRIPLLIIYYIIHKNFFFGFLYKLFFNNFHYKNLVFNLKSFRLPISNYSSFFFNTYEYNDRILIEKYINKKNNCIIIGGGLGFIATLCFVKSKKKILIFEIDKSICDNLTQNLYRNSCKFSLYNNNLFINNKHNKIFTKYKYFFYHNDFLSNSAYRKSNKTFRVENITPSRILDFNNFNTLVIDAEGMEKYYINNIKFLNNIHYLFFEMHYDLLNFKEIKKIHKILINNNFFLVDKCFNSFFYKKKFV
jgi:FkbM family methyltransferase